MCIPHDAVYSVEEDHIPQTEEVSPKMEQLSIFIKGTWELVITC